MTSRADEQFLAQLRLETDALLAQRVRGGLWLLLVALVLFAAIQLEARGVELGALLAIKALQLGTIVAAFLALRSPWLRRQCRWIALAVVTEVCTTTAMSGIVTADWDTTILLTIVLTMGTATLLPWGVHAQIATVAIASATAAWNTVVVTGGVFPVESPVVAAGLAALTSIYVAWALEHHRLAQRTAEEHARRGEARKGAILEAAIDCIVTIDQEGRILEFNPAAEKTFGYARSAVLGRAMADVIVPPGLRAAHRRGLANYLQTGEGSVLGTRIETTAMRSDGSELPVELAITRIAGDGPPIFTGYLRDLRERRLAEAAQASAALAAVGRELMVLLETPTILERFTRLATEVLECDASLAFVRRPGEAALTVEHRAGDPALLPETPGATVHGTSIADLVGLLRRDGSATFARRDPDEVTVADPVWPAGATAVLCTGLWRNRELLAVLVSCHGRSAATFSARQRELARGMAQIASMALTNAHLVEELGRADRVKSEFLSTISHELRTPMNGIVGYAEMVDDESFSASERSEFAASIRTSARQLLELIEDTLAVGNLNSESAEPCLEPVWLPALWTTMAEQCTALRSSGATVLEWLDEVPPEMLHTDSRRLGQALQHLVGNALKFTEEGSVRVSAATEQDALVISVSDTGPGIAPELHETIFELFRQGDGSETRKHGGTGLGLFLARGIVESLGGRIWVESAPGHGATFRVGLPRSAGAAAKLSAPCRPVCASP